MTQELVDSLKKKYPNVEIERMIRIWEAETATIKSQFPEGHPGRELRVPLDSDLTGNLITVVISKYVKSLNEK